MRTGVKKLAATAKYVAAPPTAFSARPDGVSTESMRDRAHDEQTHAFASTYFPINDRQLLPTDGAGMCRPDR